MSAEQKKPDHEDTEFRSGYKIPSLRVFSEIATTLSSDADLEFLLDRFLQTLIRLAGASGGAVRVVTGDGLHMRLVGAIGLPQEVIDREHLVPIACGVCGEAAREFGIRSADAAQVCHENIALDFFGNRCKRVVAVPLRHKGKVMGVYNLFMPADKPIPEEVSLLFLSISEHLGMALENARLTRENIRITLMGERQMLANEIHDSLAQTLAYMKMRLAMLRESVEEKNEAKTDKYLDEVDDAMETAYSGLRELLHQFRQKMDPRGLVPALDDLFDGFRKRTGIDVDFSNRALDINLTPDQEVQVFHIVQESLANISKHSHARQVRVTIEIIDNRYGVTVEDDGIGLGAPSSGGVSMHLGMNIMRERAQRLGGDLIAENKVGAGTRIHLEFPATTFRKVNAS